MANIIMIGNPIDGFEFIGPFSSREKAIEYASIHCCELCHIGNLISPVKDEDDHDFEDDDYWDRHSEAVERSER